ncbi:MAG: restriction endonuclease subunit S, partial [Aridibacter sp.]
AELNPNFLALTLQQMFKKGVFLEMCNKWIGQAGVNNKALAEIKIPLPPLSIQKEIVEKIEGFQEEI